MQSSRIDGVKGTDERESWYVDIEVGGKGSKFSWR